MIRRSLRPLRTLVLAGTVLLVGAGTVLAAAAPASAARDLGGVAWSAAKGTPYTTLSLFSEGPCPAEARYVKATAHGHGFPKDGQVIVQPNELLLSRTQPMGLSVSQAFVIYAEWNNTALVGDYDVTISCTDRFGLNSIGDFTTTMTWKTPGGKFANIDKATFTAENTAKVDRADVYVPPGDLAAGLPPIVEEPSTGTDAEDGAGKAPRAESAEPRPTEEAPTAPSTAADGSTPVPSSGAATPAPDQVDPNAAPAASEATEDEGGAVGTALLWLGAGVLLLGAAGALWFWPKRRSAD